MRRRKCPTIAMGLLSVSDPGTTVNLAAQVDDLNLSIRETRLLISRTRKKTSEP